MTRLLTGLVAGALLAATAVAQPAAAAPSPLEASSAGTKKACKKGRKGTLRCRKRQRIARPLTRAQSKLSSASSDLKVDEVLRPDQYRLSPNKRYLLLQQRDGNLALYDKRTGEALWASGTHSSPGASTILQKDGQLVVYAADRRVAWDSATRPSGLIPDMAGTTKLTVRDDGSLVLFVNGQAVWSSRSALSRLRTGELLRADNFRLSASRRVMLVQQHDGNLVLRRDGRALWASHTDGNPGAYTVLQADGNLVLYSANQRALWSSSTLGNPGASLLVQDDANAVLYVGDRPIWTTQGR